MNLAQAEQPDPPPTFGESADTLRQVLDWSAQYALMSIVVGGTIGVGAWVWGALSANPMRTVLGQRVLLITCAAALALGLIAPLLNTFASAAGH